MDNTTDFPQTPEYKHEVVIAKIISLVILAISSFVLILLPSFINCVTQRKQKHEQFDRNAGHGPKSEFILSLTLAFGGGVLVSTTFLHLLPEVREGIEELTKLHKLPEELPLSAPEFIMCIGFFIMFVVEELVHKYLHSRQHKIEISNRNKEIELYNRCNGHKDELRLPPSTNSKANLVSCEIVPEDSSLELGMKIDDEVKYVENIKIAQENLKNYGSYHNNANVDQQHNHFGHSHAASPLTESKVVSIRELLLVLALTVHEVFEGIALGLESDLNSVWYLLTAVAVHKSVIAFCIGVEMVSAGTSVFLVMVYSVIFAIAAPVGISVGLFFTVSEGDMGTASVILQGIATGTLLYVVFFEVLKKDPGKQRTTSHMFAVLIGFAVMAVLQSTFEA